MNENKLIIKFYNCYKKMHEKLEKEVVFLNENSGVDVTFFLNRILILFFLEKKFLTSNEEIFSLKKVMEKMKLEKNYHMFFEKFIFKNIIEKYKNENSEIKPFFIENYIEEKNKTEKSFYFSNSVFEDILKNFLIYDFSLNENSRDSITPHIIGYIFEKYVNQKQTGSYYTSADTTNYIIKFTVISKLISNLNKKFNLNISVENMIKENENIVPKFKELLTTKENYLEYTLEKIIGEKENVISIIDPTCGSGAFIISSIEIIEDIVMFCLKEILDKNYMSNSYLYKLKNDISKEKNLKYFICRNIIEKNIYGVDLLSEAIEILRLRLYLKLISTIETTEEIREMPQLDKNFLVGNILVGNINEKTVKYDYKYSFNWNEKFKHIFKNGGFDCVIGNPPYIEISKVKTEYHVNDIEFIKSGNLYAYVIERSFQILKKDGCCGMIVPISLVSTSRMSNLRKWITEKSKYSFFANFSDRPGCLFQGVHQKLTIFLIQKTDKKTMNNYTTSYLHWYSLEEREMLFEKIKYYKNLFENNLEVSLFKIGNKLEESIVNKILLVDKSIKDNFAEKENSEIGIYLNMRMTFWVKCFSKKQESKEYKFFSCENKEKTMVLLTILNSSLFFMFWEIVSDNWHITNKELSLFKFDSDILSKEMTEILYSLGNQLELDLERNKRYIGSKQVEYEYVHKKSKEIIDRIDDVISEYYNLSMEELEYVKNYNINYR